MPGSFILTLTENDGSVSKRQVTTGSYVIGREVDCDIVVNSSDVSRHHARLTLNQVELLIEDLDSGSGTRVKGVPVTGQQRLPYPQSLSFGSVNLEVLALEETAEATVTAWAADQRAEVPATTLGADPTAAVPFVFGHEIARGGMGSIIEADDRKLGRKIAVKVMLREADADDAQKQRFVQEAAVLGKLEHPNIVPVHDLGLDARGQLYYTMKLVKGRTLQAILNDLRRETPEALRQGTMAHLLTIFRKICDAMAFAHSKGIIHRDLKPENIMVGEFGEVLVMDWGLAKILDGSADSHAISDAVEGGRQASLHSSGLSATLDGSIMGTPQYMSPEQAAGRIAEMDARSDIWSLGGILYAILTLRPPVEGKKLEEVLHKVISGSITPLAAAGQARRLPANGKAAGSTPAPQRLIPPALAAVTMKALSVKREARYQTVAALSTDIDAYQNGFATSAENAGAWRQFTLFVKRHKAASIGVAAVLVVLAAFLTNVVLSRQRMAVTLFQLRGTAPTFRAQAQALLEEGKPDEALDKIAYAISLQPENPGYHLFRANLLQSGQHLTEAADEYRRVLELQPADKAAKENLILSEHLDKENGGAATLNSKLMGEFVDALIKQGRKIEAAPMQRIIGNGQDAIEAALRARLKEYTSQKGWLDSKLARLSDGTFTLNLSNLQIGDLARLNGFPISKLYLGGNNNLTKVPLLPDAPIIWLLIGGGQIEDLSLLRGRPLKVLEVSKTSVHDLSPLAGMPLEELNISSTRVKDCSPLRGMKLKKLHIGNTAIRDLSPLQGMPLEELRIASKTSFSDLTPLRGLPLKILVLDKCYGITDFTSLASLASLEELWLLKQIEDLGFLMHLPRLQRIYVEDQTPAIIPVAEYWKLSPRAVPPDLHVRNVVHRMMKNTDPGQRVSIDPDGRIKVNLGESPVSDVTPLAGLPIVCLNLHGSKVTDITPLRGMPLVEIGLLRTGIKDVACLADCLLLEEITLPKDASGVEKLRSLPNLRYISYNSDIATGRPDKTAEEFWKKYDTQQAAGKK